jgi:high affinity choline transporter 7
MGEVAWGGVMAVAVMYAAFLVVGWLAARKVREGTASELMVAGRAMPLWVATMTMTATWVDGGYLLGTTEYVYQHGLAIGIQGGVCFGLSLILGGLFFARRMRRMEYATLVDPFEVRFGKRWAAVLFLPAMLGELFWSGALLVAIGSTFGVLLNLDLTTAIIVSAVVVASYTVVGGMWSVAYTDAFQLLLIPIGLLAALPFALDAVGGLEACLHKYATEKQAAARLIPPLQAGDGYWTVESIVAWWDMSIMLVLGGIPWNCYFQRVLSCQTPAKAAWHSIFSGILTIGLTLPPVLLGMAAYAYWGMGGIDPPLALPLLLKQMTPYAVMILGLAAIIGAVTSSFSASILSAGSMLSWNVYRRLLVPHASVGQMRAVIRGAIVLLAAVATVLALHVQSVAALWLFTGDLVFVLLFPPLVMALYDPKANRTGSMVAFAVALVFRLGGGEPLFGLPAFLPYAELLPFRTLATLAGLVLLPLVSRLTARWDPPQALRKAS